MFRKQFLLTYQKDIPLDWEVQVIGEMNLFTHPELKATKASKLDSELILLGALFDWENPSYSNQEIINEIINSDTLEMLFSKIGKYCGQFVIIYRLGGRVIVFNDACAQSEIYYTSDYSSIGTQPKLISQIVDLKLHQESDAKEFYESDIFKKQCLFICETTHVKNIFHLLPNHYLDISKKKTERFFPIVENKELEIEVVASKAIKVIKGYLKAISLRYEATLGVTAGVDSRVLFLTSLKTKCSYFVNKDPVMNDDHHDVDIAKKLVSLMDKEIDVINFNRTRDADEIESFKKSVDFPLFWNLVKENNPNKAIVNGNVSEIARNYYGYFKDLNGNDLAFLNKYKNEKFAGKKYNEWLKNNSLLFEKLGYNYLDMFYWEERMGNWFAKATTESNAMGRNVVSPFNSRDLLKLLLSTKRLYRDSHFNKLYDAIFQELYMVNEDLKEIPFNPTWKSFIIRTLKKLKFYNWYKFVGLKLRLY